MRCLQCGGPAARTVDHGLNVCARCLPELPRWSDPKTSELEDSIALDLLLIVVTAPIWIGYFAMLIVRGAWLDACPAVSENQKGKQNEMDS